MIKELPISNSARPCLVDDDVSHWFEGTALTLDNEGVYFETEQQRFYVHDQVMIIKRGTADSIHPASRMRLYVRSRGDPRVRAYYDLGRRRRTLQQTKSRM